jgi:phosphate transport system permease protein
MLYGSVLLAVVGLVIAVPASLLLSIFIVFLAPRRLATVLTNVIDLMAAIPSIILGLWAFYLLNPQAEEWQAASQSVPRLVPDLPERLGQLPRYSLHRRLRARDHDDPDHHLGHREVLGRTPPELINAAEALGCSLWTMLRYVALPYGRGGIVGGIMLGLGRAPG